MLEIAVNVQCWIKCNLYQGPLPNNYLGHAFKYTSTACVREDECCAINASIIIPHFQEKYLCILTWINTANSANYFPITYLASIGGCNCLQMGICKETQLCKVPLIVVWLAACKMTQSCHDLSLARLDSSKKE